MKLNQIVAKGLIASPEFENNLVSLLEVNNYLARALAEGLKTPTQEEVEEKKEKALADLLRDYKDCQIVTYSIGSFWYDNTDFTTRAPLKVVLKRESGEELNRSMTLYF